MAKKLYLQRITAMTSASILRSSTYHEPGRFSAGFLLMGVIPSEAVFHAERGISLSTEPWRGRSLVPRLRRPQLKLGGYQKTRDFGMTPVKWEIFKLSH